MTDINDPYHDIRPYNDEEIPAAIERLINDEEFINAILQHRFSNHASWFKTLMSPILKVYLKLKWAKFTSVEAIQIEVGKYLRKSLKETTKGVTFSGLDKLDKNCSYLFMSNHRDIAMDPALVNFGLHNEGHRTSHIAIGDNLLKKPCTTELMRINKSFIVKRSAKAPREMMKALSQLSSYIKHSLSTGNSIWIAQKEGRAKDGNDQTDPAILKMLHVEGRKQKMPFADYIKTLKIVPVAISYENDPCDLAKAKELFEKSESGSYEKGEFEDIESIIQGMIGFKGRVHISFGDVIDGDIETPDELAKEIDNQIHNIYKLFPINYCAAQVDCEECTQEAKNTLDEKLAQLPKGAHDYLTGMYAYPVQNRHSLSD
ncbi:1-acyl-sn-glycerol-3-phosphate acyltransferase [Vibrio tapetis]|uniref:Putative Glycerol-3-phosphate (1)-acyltransferase n=1 Tax=Vibrio tapetis subsp. tapetis TaxID=1671868 RepID=A0A2N8ZMU2_9VIBR|nr:1-acyl-sn-glycerol-3-phosphate acyltransferase [Vibrio tapetis]SON53189.1 putative Glycerol-3-phosphate (1)-acyltransferase [Vibrio tapetis subsp. tapetis]